MPVSSEGDSLSVASQVMSESTSTRAFGRETTGAWPKHLPFQQIANCGRPANSTSSLLYEEKDVYALPFAQHSTAVDCCFLDDAPCR